MRVAVVGLGLIGGSVALRAAEQHDVLAWDTDPATRDLARAAGLAVADGVGAALADAEVVVLAVPLDALAATVADLTGRLSPQAVLTDVGSVKGPVYAAAVAAGLGERYVGGHPMFGREVAGFAAADPTLVEDAAWVLTLEPDTDLTAWLTVATLVGGLGARVVPCSVAAHDAAVARISHLPHLLAAALSVVAADGGPLALSLAAGSFRDGTRVAATPAALTTAMCRQNAPAVGDAVGDAVRRLQDDPAALLAAGHAVRRSWPAAVAAGVPLDRPDPRLREALLELGRRGGWVSGVAADHIAVQGPA